MKKLFLFVIAPLLIVFLFSCSVYRVGPGDLIQHVSRLMFSRSMAIVYHDDIESARRISDDYCIGVKALRYSSAADSWKNIEKQTPELHVLGESTNVPIVYDIPFVYEKPDTPGLVALRERYQLSSIIKKGTDEYDAMLRLAAWVGTRWDHGVDLVPGGTILCNPVEVVRAGEGGAKFWCEIAARLMVRAATALGWPARLVTASRDGYTWEHAVAELWSNQYQKWFVVDTDFNVVYETNNIPLSAFELCHEGAELQRKGQLQTRLFAPLKRSLKPLDLIPYYRYVHIDMRNDWCTRILRRGSPVGGDLATWWTANAEIGTILTAKTEVRDKQTFNWQVNTVDVHCLSAKRLKRGVNIEVGLVGYSPYFEKFEVAVDSGPWRASQSGRLSFIVLTGQHTIRARIVTVNGNVGPVSDVQFSLHEVS